MGVVESRRKRSGTRNKTSKGASVWDWFGIVFVRIWWRCVTREERRDMGLDAYAGVIA